MTPPILDAASPKHEVEFAFGELVGQTVQKRKPTRSDRAGVRHYAQRTRQCSIRNSRKTLLAKGVASTNVTVAQQPYDCATFLK